ncbi:hypothetical protein F5Y16DRAFT_412465 [Xylariaceae sp. FL0255]|nr:hypothetical protein F5Y16DRAFT_412465 [Xylariaceae sp. FL0255]
MIIAPPSAASSPTSVSSPMSTESTPSLSMSELTIKPANVGLRPAVLAPGAPIPPKTSITSKEWVVPPRPKPGRKPATDTPPTKRKAQNRAAQRAFRERRAARVGELEEQLDEQRDESDRAQQQLRDQVRGLDAVVETLRKQCIDLEETLERERAQKTKIADELEVLKQRWHTERPRNSSRNDSFISRHDTITGLSSQRSSHHDSTASNAAGGRNPSTNFSISHMISPPDSVETPRDASVGCGGCTLGTKCECLEAIVNNSGPDPDTELKRKPSSISVLEPEEKRIRQNIYPNEIDFTSLFSSKRDPIGELGPTEPQISLQSPPQPVPPRDSCGFCTESSYCMCAEAAAAQTLAPIGQQVQTPPPSDSDVGPSPMEVTSTGAIKLPSISSLNRTAFRAARNPTGCGPNGPGTCAQCLRDPKSGLFCRSLATKFARESGKPSDGCCGRSAGGGCCKNKDTSTQDAASSSALSLSCADAYKTLSSHPGFEKASDEIDTWLPKLRAVPKAADAHAPNRTALDVETASIMGVLKEFDVRFGRNK